jgi:hypothetical protein
MSHLGADQPQRDTPTDGGFVGSDIDPFIAALPTLGIEGRFSAALQT